MLRQVYSVFVFCSVIFLHLFLQFPPNVHVVFQNVLVDLDI